MTLALLLAGGGEALAGLAGGASKIDRLSKEQRDALKELERKDALGLLGLDAGQQQRLLNQQLQPVRAEQQQAYDVYRTSQQVEDIGQGSAFRQQQALQSQADENIARATREAQRQVDELDRIAQARELAKLQRLKQQQQQNRQGVAEMFGAVGEGLGTAGDVMVFQKQMESYEKAFGKAKKEVAKTTDAEGEDYANSFIVPTELPYTTTVTAGTVPQDYYANKMATNIFGTDIMAEGVPEDNELLRAILLQQLAKGSQ